MEPYKVTNADKKGNTPAWQGYVSNKKNVKTGTPLNELEDHITEEEIGKPASLEERNRKIRSPIRLLEVLGLPTFKEEDITTPHDTRSNRVSYWNVLYLLPVIVFCVSYTFIVTLIPQSNQMEFPHHWYQLALLLAVK